MKLFFKVIMESIRQAFQQLKANKLRSFLSLLGVSIGIFSIIGVLSAVDSLEDNVRSSLEKLGDDVVYVSKWPWRDASNDWWDLIKRPQPTHDDYEAVVQKSRLSQLAAFHVFIGVKTIKFKSYSVENTYLLATTQEYDEMFSMEFTKGRYFSPTEYRYGSNKMVIGTKVAEELFGSIDPIGRKVKLMGKNYEIIGVIAPSGDDLVRVMVFDQCLFVSYTNAKSLANLKSKQVFETMISVKAINKENTRDMKDELKGIIRTNHRLKPKQDDDFSLNELTMITTQLDAIFGVMNLLGIVIGFFAFLVGGVSVANIMFVSVKERTSIIGIKKALGAKRGVILLEFLIEAIILCLIGGVIGLIIVAIVAKILTSAIDFHLYLDFGNIMIGLVSSIIVGVVSGLVPAIQASKLDPVEAMRRK